MGSPQNSTVGQIVEPEKAGQLQTTGQPTKMVIQSGKLQLLVTLPRPAVSLFQTNL
jgi:hypothetical protein